MHVQLAAELKELQPFVLKNNYQQSRASFLVTPGGKVKHQGIGFELAIYGR